MAGSIVRTGFERELQLLREDLDAVELGLGSLVGEVARDELGPVVAEIERLLPFDPAHRGWSGRHKRPDPGHIRASARASSTRNTLIVASAHPGAGVQWWGGTIAPRGVPITIERRPGAGREFVSKEAERVGRNVEDALDRLCREHGL